MAKLKDCWAELGLQPRNQRWWSARNEKAKRVGLTFWSDHLGNQIYKMPAINEHRKPAFREMIKDIKYALEHCNGLVSVILIRAVSVVARTRQVQSNECRVLKMQWRITFFDEATGEFTAIPA